MPSPKAKGLEELFTDTLKDIYFAEKQILRALPKMAKSASSQELSQAFEKHREETEGHVERLEEIFETMKKPARGKTCDAIIGIIEEGKEIMEEYAGDSALDAGLAASAQAVEHYEIARYGTLRTWAEQLGMKDAAMILDENSSGGDQNRPTADETSHHHGQPKSGVMAHLSRMPAFHDLRRTLCPALRSAFEDQSAF